MSLTSISAHAQNRLTERLYKYANKTEVDTNILVSLDFYRHHFKKEKILVILAELPVKVRISKKYGEGNTLVGVFRDNVLVTVFVTQKIHDFVHTAKRFKSDACYTMHEVIEMRA